MQQARCSNGGLTRAAWLLRSPDSPHMHTYNVLCILRSARAAFLKEYSAQRFSKGENHDLGTFSSVFAHLPRSNFNFVRTPALAASTALSGTSCGFKFSSLRPCAAVWFSVRREFSAENASFSRATPFLCVCPFELLHSDCIPVCISPDLVLGFKFEQSFCFGA